MSRLTEAAERRQADVRGAIGRPRHIHEVVDPAVRGRELIPSSKKLGFRVGKGQERQNGLLRQLPAQTPHDQGRSLWLLSWKAKKEDLPSCQHFDSNLCLHRATAKRKI